MIRSHFNRDLGILEVNYSGKLNFTELKKFGDQLILNDNLPRELRILTDVREGEYDFSENELPGVMDALRNQTRFFRYVKAAFVQTKPRETAISLIVEQRNSIPNYHHRVFSTPEAAKKWLMENNI